MIIKNFNTHQHYIPNLGMLAIFLLMLTSGCKKDKQTDLDILSAKLPPSSISYVEKGRTLRFNGQSYSSTKSFVGVALSLLQPSEGGDTIYAKVNTDLVDIYNSKYSENNLKMPSNTFGVSNNGRFAVRANSDQALDSLHVTLLDGSALKDKSVYLVPVELSTKSGGALKHSVIFFKIAITEGSLNATFRGGAVYSYRFPYYVYGSLIVPNYNVGRATLPPDVKLSVGINTPFTFNNVTISAEIGTEADALAIGKKFNSYLPQMFPADTYTLTKDLTTVVSGSTLAQDSIAITLKNTDKFVIRQDYFLPVKIKYKSTLPFSVSPSVTDSATAYIRVYVGY